MKTRVAATLDKQVETAESLFSFVLITLK